MPLQPWHVIACGVHHALHDNSRALPLDHDLQAKVRPHGIFM